MLRLVNLQTGNDPIRNTFIIINKRHRPHGPAHTQGCNQLVACGTGAVNGYSRKAIITVGKWQMLSGRKPPSMIRLSHQ